MPTLTHSQFLNFFLVHGEGRVSSDEEERVTVLSSTALEPNVCGFCCAVFSGIASNYMIDDRLTIWQF